jgi:hypothetical protein
MTAFNVIRVRVKEGREEEFIKAHRRMKPEDFPGSRRGLLIKTGERAYCLIGEWDSMDALVAARPRMISVATGFGDTLEDLAATLDCPMPSRVRLSSTPAKTPTPVPMPSP